VKPKKALLQRQAASHYRARQVIVLHCRHSYIRTYLIDACNPQAPQAPRGIRNVGNSCFLNSLLQSVSAIPTFARACHRSVGQGRFDKGAGSSAFGSACTSAVVSLQATAGAKEPYNPKTAYEALLRCNGWQRGQQQDVHDLFLALLASFPAAQVSLSCPFMMRLSLQRVHNVSLQA
jgi:ubiquitin C-terminal hydrolase